MAKYPCRLLIYGNSGSGKTTMARRLAKERGLEWMSLDDIAWKPDSSAPARRPREDCGLVINGFMERHPRWVMDGCYGDLIAYALRHATELRFLNPGVDVCVEHCRQRPWEPDKYPTEAAQDAMLETLVEWVNAYD